MRVVTVTGRFPNPREPFIVDDVVALADRGVEASVVAAKIDLQADPRSRARLGGRVDIRAPNRIMTRLQLPPQWADGRGDVVNFQHFYIARDNVDRLARLRAAKVVTIQGSEIRVAPVGRPDIREQTLQVFELVDRIHCVSQELADRCIELGAPADRVHVTRRGIDVDLFKPRAGGPRPKDGVTRVVSVGRVHWVKGYDYALQAIRLLCDAGHRISYTIVGDEDGAGDAVRLAIHDLGLEDVVTLAEHVPHEEVPAVLAASDVFLLSSVSEGLSLATLEAMAVGLPVVVTAPGGANEAVVDGVHGRIVPSRDPVALADAVTEVVASDVGIEMGRRASEQVRANFDHRVRADEMVEIYRDLVATRSVKGTAAPRSIAVRSRPKLVTVVVPVRNEVADLPGQLAALSEQTYSGGWELLICDNGSTDGTQDVAWSWRPKFSDLSVIDASRHPGCNHARNVGITNANGEFIVFIDADDVASPGWLEAMVEAASENDVVGGSLDDLATHGSQAIPDALITKLDFLPSVPGGNCGIWASVAEELAWDEEYGVGGSDIEFAWRAQLAGKRVGYARDALVSVRRPTKLGAIACQWHGYGSSEALLYRKFRNHGMPRSRFDVAYRQWRWLVLNLGDVFRGGERREQWVRKAAYRTGRITGSVKQRVIFL